MKKTLLITFTSLFMLIWSFDLPAQSWGSWMDDNDYSKLEYRFKTGKTYKGKQEVCIQFRNSYAKDMNIQWAISKYNVEATKAQRGTYVDASDVSSQYVCISVDQNPGSDFQFKIFKVTLDNERYYPDID